MTKNKIFQNKNFLDLSNRKDWPSVLVDNIPIKNQKIYLNRKKAIDMYFDDVELSKITEETNIERHTITRLAKRCLELDENGEVYGYTALIPYKRIKSYKRTNNTTEKCTGKFDQLLNEYPELKDFIENTFFGFYKKSNLEKNIITSILYQKFIKKCHQLNIKENEYPFNTKDAGRRSLYRYINFLKNVKYQDYLNRLDDNSKSIAKSTGIGNQNNPIINRPFQQVQFDGHKIDAMICIKFKTIEGDIIKKTMSRIWILVIIDVATRVVLGYHLCLNSEYSSSDVLKCIENAIKPKEKLNLTIPNLKYPNNVGFHSITIPETKWAIWDEFLYDNAKANLAKSVSNILANELKCSINAGPVATPERRGIVERFFKTLETYGFHRLTNTTGSNIYDSKRKKAEENAIEYEISEYEIEQITEILIANYNNTPHNGINGFSPLELMKQRIEERGFIPRTIDENERNDLNFCKMKIIRKIRGKRDAGRAPYIFYEGVEYRNDVLSRSIDLIGLELTLLVDLNDLRYIKAYLPDGGELGILTAKGKWSLKKHSLKMRKEINKLKRDKQINFSILDDPIEIYHQYLVTKSIDNKSARNKLATLNKLQKIENNIENKYPQENTQNKITNTQLTNTDREKVEELRNSNIFKTLNF